ALRAKELIRSYVSAPVKGQLAAGDVWIAQLWNGDTVQARAEQPEVQFVVPREGAIMWIDTMMIPRGASHKKAAHAFLNYVLRPEWSAPMPDPTGSRRPTQPALAWMRTPVPCPTDARPALLEHQNGLGAAAALWDRLWTEIKAG